MDELNKSTGIMNPLTIIQAMVEKGGDPETLRKMLDLQERWERNQAEKAWNDAKAACDAEMPAAFACNADNQHTKSKYRRFETIMPIIKPIYTRHGFTFTFSEEEPTEALMHIRADLSHKAGHTKSYHGWFPRDGKGAKGGDVMNPVQGTCSTMSYAKREMSGNIFGFAEGGTDQDGNNFITPEQLAEIDELFRICDERDKAVDTARFLKWAGVEDITKLPDKSYAKVIAELKRKAGLK